MGRHTTEMFLAKLQAVHGEKFDYSLVVYTGSRGKIKLICPVHGVIEKEASSALQGWGCKQCNQYKPRKHSLQEKISNISQVHGGKYDYSLIVADFDWEDKVPIICAAHGVFYQKPSNHRTGSGCPSCTNLGQTFGKGAYLELFLKQHGVRYSYDLVPEHFTAHDKISIICPEHGVFQQRANSHRKGMGCLRCDRVNNPHNEGGWGKAVWVARIKDKARLYLVMLESDAERFYKVGITSTDLKRRLSDVKKDYKFTAITTIESVDAGYIWDLEKKTHRKFKHLKYKPLIKFAGSGECYTNPTEIMAFLSQQKSPA